MNKKLLALAVTTILVGCGSGDGDDDNNSGNGGSGNLSGKAGNQSYFQNALIRLEQIEKVDGH